MSPVRRRSGSPWLVVTAVFVVLAVVAGLTFYSMSAYLDSLTEAGFSLALVSLGPTLTAAAGGVGGVVVARLMRRISTRALMAAGAVVAAAALSWIGRANRPWELCAAFLLFGGAAAFASVVPCSDLVARWFMPHPERAIAVATTGMSVGGAIAPPLVLGALNRFGLDRGSIYVGTAMALVVLLACLGIQEPQRPRAPLKVAADRSRPWRPRLPRRPFGLLFCAFGLLVFSQVATVTHVLRIARERGLAGGAMVLSIIAVASIVGRVVGIPLTGAVGIRWFALLIACAQAAAQAVLASAADVTMLYGGAALLGTTMGNTFVLMSLFVLAEFDLQDYPSTYAWLATAGTIGAGAGPLFLGLSAERLGSYTLPLLVLAASSAIGAVLLAVSRVDNRPQVPLVGT